MLGFDIDEKYVNHKTIFLNDSLNNPKQYGFILTNPPYLHKNKADTETKELFFGEKHKIFEDLYQISIFEMMKSQEGILIVPLNFLSAENSGKIRKIFFEKFEIVKMNIFLEQVFDDTTYNVIAFYFKEKKGGVDENKIFASIFPESKQIEFTLEKKFDWQLGGEFLTRVRSSQNHLGVMRLTEDFLQAGDCQVDLAVQNIKAKQKFFVDKTIKSFLKKNILFLRAIDSKNGKKIQLEDIRSYDVEGLVGKQSSRNMAHLIFSQPVGIEEQKELMQKFNEVLTSERKKYFSFFLTNFRDNGRKRISFDFVYKFLNYIYDQENTKQPSLF